MKRSNQRIGGSVSDRRFATTRTIPRGDAIRAQKRDQVQNHAREQTIM